MLPKTLPATSTTAAPFFDEYQPATPTETQLTQHLADTAWRLNRIPSLEAELFSQNPNPQTLIPLLATLGMHSQRLSRQFQKSLHQLREIQAERRFQEERALKRAAALLELHKHKGIPYDPAQLFSENGFVFSKDQIEAFAQRLMRLNQSRHLEHVLFHMQPPIMQPPSCSRPACRRKACATPPAQPPPKPHATCAPEIPIYCWNAGEEHEPSSAYRDYLIRHQYGRRGD